MICRKVVIVVQTQDENSVGGVNDGWTDLKKPARGVKSKGSHHRLRHTIINLSPATDYEAAVQVKNTRQWGNLGKFNFSTRKGKRFLFVPS